MKYVSTSDSETKELGKKFAKKLIPGDIVFLYGDLGFGKTTFTAGVAEGMGIKARIISPTFTIVRVHENMHHIDLYRIENEKQLQEIGVKEILDDKSSVKLIEWPEKLYNSWNGARWEVKFDMNKDTARVININKIYE